MLSAIAMRINDAFLPGTDYANSRLEISIKGGCVYGTIQTVVKPPASAGHISELKASF